MKIKNNLFKWSLLAVVITFASCETMDLNQIDNPSQVSANQLDPVYAFNYIQVQLPAFVHSANQFTQRMVRQKAMTGGNTYDNAFAPVNSNTNWTQGYNILNAIKVMEPKAIATQETYALGAAKLIRVYILMTMVDLYGNIPYSEALQGSANLTPKFDNSADIYRNLLLEIDNAVAILNQPNAPGSKIESLHLDLYYGSQGGWITLANTLKLKMYCTARLAGADFGVDIPVKINEIVTGGNYIDQEIEDFAFRYGNNRSNPNTRHPDYNDEYELGGGDYLGNYMMWAMTTEKSTNPTQFSPKWDKVTSGDVNELTDPRIHFYFYKQREDPSDFEGDTFTLPKKTRPAHYDNNQYKSFYNPGTAGTGTPYLVSNWVDGTGIESDGFWGRDHGDNSGIPPDQELRTVIGIYPAGGKYGPAGEVQNSGTDGAKGAGIMPIILSSYVHFMLAEAALVYPGAITGITPASEFEAGIRASINKTINIVPDYEFTPASQPDYAAFAGQTQKYVDFELAKFNAAGTNQLELIIKEYYIASWGNGIEPYNAYRRTGYPSNFQPTLESSWGDFYSTAYYALDSTVNNPNAPSNVRTRKTFWDKAGLTLH